MNRDELIEHINKTLPSCQMGCNEGDHQNYDQLLLLVIGSLDREIWELLKTVQTSHFWYA